MTDCDLSLELSVDVLEASAATALGHAELVDWFLALAPGKYGYLTEVVSELRTPESAIGEVGHGKVFGILSGLGFAGVVHGDKDGASLKEDGGKVMPQEAACLLLIRDVYASK